MSNHFAIATVTATLQQLLDGAVSADVPGAQRHDGQPGRRRGGLADPGVNIFLYQVIPNAAWRNEDLPTRTPSGGARAAPARRHRPALPVHVLRRRRRLRAAARAGDARSATLHAKPVLTRNRRSSGAVTAIARARSRPTSPPTSSS